jgi:transposase-like protein
MIQTKPLTGQCPRCGATAEHLAYHSRYALKSGQMVTVIRCKQHNGTFCDRYGTAFYDLKTSEEKVQRAIQQSLEGICPEAVARIEDVHSTTVQRWIERASQQAKAADREVITGVAQRTSNWMSSTASPVLNILTSKRPTLMRLASTGRTSQWCVNHV